MKGLERFPEPWRVEQSGNEFVVVDARGQRLADIGQPAMSESEAVRLAGLVARLPVLWRRPQY